MRATPRSGRTTYELHGLRIRSAVPLSAPLSKCVRPDVDVRWGARRAVPAGPPSGEIVASLSLGGGRGYCCTRNGRGGHTLRYNETCEFQIDRSLRTVVVHLAPGVDPAMASLLLAGQVSAFFLTLAGECALHASAVKVGASALAFVGASGMGKSTLAALFCAGGARLISDDLLRVESDGRNLRCFPGTTEIRLRQGAAFLAERFPAARLGTTVDERIAIRFPSMRRRPLPLRAVVIPLPSKTARTVRLERLPLTRAFLALNGYTTLAGLQAPEPLRRRFLTLANVAKSMRVYEAELPWAPPLHPAVARDLLRGVGLDGHPRGVEA